MQICLQQPHHQLLLLRRCINDTLIDASWLAGPAVFGCATDTSVSPARPYIFRTYEFPPGPDTERRAQRLALHDGSSRHHVWQAVRASSAAPSYLDDYTLGPHRFSDGAVTVNNPAVRPKSGRASALSAAEEGHASCAQNCGCGGTRMGSEVARALPSRLEQAAACKYSTDHIWLCIVHH